MRTHGRSTRPRAKSFNAAARDGRRGEKRGGVEEEAFMSAQQTCPGCGMEQEVWKGNGGQGVDKEGATYCCQECADGAGCICG